MATIVKNWANGDPLTLETSAGGISVLSAPNLTGVDREMDITVRTTNNGTKASKVVSIVQRKKQGRASYWADIGGGVHYFELGNTPIGNFYGDTYGATYIINSVPVYAYDIKEIVFGDSYKAITSIGDGFLYDWASLISVDLSGFENVTSIGEYFLFYCESLPSVDLSAMTGLSFIGWEFLSYCLVLTEMFISAVIPPSLSDSFTFIDLLTSIYVPAQSVELYKVATNWKNYADKIKPL